MLLKSKTKTDEIKEVSTDLRMQQELYEEADKKDEILSIKKVIRLKIKELQQRLMNLR